MGVVKFLHMKSCTKSSKSCGGVTERGEMGFSFFMQIKILHNQERLKFIEALRERGR